MAAGQCVQDDNDMDKLIQNLKDSMGALQLQGDGLTKQMWLLYVTFEDFIHLKHPDKVANLSVPSLSNMEEWTRHYTGRPGKIIQNDNACSAHNEKFVNSSPPKAKPWEDDSSNLDPIYTDTLIKKIATINKLESTSGSDAESPVWEGGVKERDRKACSQVTRKPIVGTSGLMQKGTQLNAEVEPEYYDLDSDDMLERITREEKARQKRHRSRRHHTSRASRAFDDSSRIILKQDKRLQSVNRSMNGIIDDLDFEVEPRCKHCSHCHKLGSKGRDDHRDSGYDLRKQALTYNFNQKADYRFIEDDVDSVYGTKRRCSDDDSYNASISSDITLLNIANPNLRKCPSCCTDMDSGFGTLSSVGKEQFYQTDFSSFYGSDSGSRCACQGSKVKHGAPSCDSENRHVEDNENIYEVIRDEDLDPRIPGKGQVTLNADLPRLPQRFSKSMDDLTSVSEFGSQEDITGVNCPFTDMWPRKPDHLVVKTAKNNILENSVIGMVFSNLDKFESRKPKRRENLYRIIGDQRNRKTFSESLAIEKKLIEDGLIYAQPDNRVRGRAEMRDRSSSLTCRLTNCVA